MKYLFPFLAIGLFLTSCERYSGPTRAEGWVVDRHTGQAVPNATVYVTGISSSPAGGGSSGTQGHATDALGHFDFTFEATGQQDYTLFAYTPSGYASDYGDCPYLTSGRANKGVQVKAAAPAWVRVNCVDDPPSSKIGLYINYPGGYHNNIGPGDYTVVQPASAYAVDSLFATVIDDRGQIINKKYPFTTTAFDTATVTLHF